MNRHSVISCALRHAFGWLFCANLVGVLLALLLCWPQVGVVWGEMTYGRWMPIHLNWQLYGWTSVPLIAWLFFVYETDRSPASQRWARAALVLWSVALVGMALSCLSGHTSGKIFLDWKDRSLWVFVIAQCVLWISLEKAFRCGRSRWSGAAYLWRLLGLCLLVMVPVSLVMAASPRTYPPIDVSTGGPTGASLLGSTLIVVALLLVLPKTLCLKGAPRHGVFFVALWVMEFLLFLLLEWRGGTHHEWQQRAGLALLLPWVYLIPLWWRGFSWPAHSLFWRRSVLCWWAVLVITGWLEFLPGLLDRMKFTNGLVAHSHLAMAGFTSSYVLLLAVALGGERLAHHLRRQAWWWHGAVGGYVVLMLWCGWMEGADASWMTEMPMWRELCYISRLLLGTVMAVVSWRWWRCAMQNEKS
jgi:cytochrome c oxidase cbb3-type subunit 1